MTKRQHAKRQRRRLQLLAFRAERLAEATTSTAAAFDEARLTCAQLLADYRSIAYAAFLAQSRREIIDLFARVESPN